MKRKTRLIVALALILQNGNGFASETTRGIEGVSNKSSQKLTTSLDCEWQYTTDEITHKYAPLRERYLISPFLVENHYINNIEIVFRRVNKQFSESTDEQTQFYILMRFNKMKRKSEESKWIDSLRFEKDLMTKTGMCYDHSKFEFCFHNKSSLGWSNCWDSSHDRSRFIGYQNTVPINDCWGDYLQFFYDHHFINDKGIGTIYEIMSKHGVTFNDFRVSTKYVNELVDRALRKMNETSNSALLAIKSGCSWKPSSKEIAEIGLPIIEKMDNLMGRQAAYWKTIGILPRKSIEDLEIIIQFLERITDDKLPFSADARSQLQKETLLLSNVRSSPPMNPTMCKWSRSTGDGSGPLYKISPIYQKGARFECSVDHIGLRFSKYSGESPRFSMYVELKPILLSDEVKWLQQRSIACDPKLIGVETNKRSYDKTSYLTYKFIFKSNGYFHREHFHGDDNHYISYAKSKPMNNSLVDFLSVLYDSNLINDDALECIKRLMLEHDAIYNDFRVSQEYIDRKSKEIIDRVNSKIVDGTSGEEFKQIAFTEISAIQHPGTQQGLCWAIGSYLLDQSPVDKEGAILFLKQITTKELPFYREAQLALIDLESSITKEGDERDRLRTDIHSLLEISGPGNKEVKMSLESRIGLFVSYGTLGTDLEAELKNPTVSADYIVSLLELIAKLKKGEAKLDQK